MKTILLSIAVLGVLGAIFGALLAVAAKIFHVEVDPRQAAVREALAGANCGGCGFPGCDGYAAAVARGEAPCNKCVAGGEATAAKVAEIMGVTADAAEKMVAFVPCSGTSENAEARFNYTGPQDCRAAMLFGGKSSKLCTFACIGLGNCERACQFDAMHVVDGVAKVDRLNCIGCMKCQRECPADAIHVVNNLAQVDTSKCVQCGHCADICPRHIINYFGKSYFVVPPKEEAAQ